MTALIGFGVVFGGILGACVASFLCVVAERVPAGKSIGGRSVCACGRQLGAFENVPVVGWLRVGGRARCCGAKLPARYLWAEAALSVVGAGAGAAAGSANFTPTALAVAAAVFAVAAGVIVALCWQRDRH